MRNSTTPPSSTTVGVAASDKARHCKLESRRFASTLLCDAAVMSRRATWQANSSRASVIVRIDRRRESLFYSSLRLDGWYAAVTHSNSAIAVSAFRASSLRFRDRTWNQSQCHLPALPYETRVMTRLDGRIQPALRIVLTSEQWQTALASGANHT